MLKLKKQISFETTFGTYVVAELLGEGGAGQVYGGVDGEGAAIAVKVLAAERATMDKRRRFKREIEFLARNRHANVVSVIDYGLTASREIFYVMHRYHGSLRDLMQAGIAPVNVLPLFSQILDGVEAAHLQGVIHRDLKPENILHIQKDCAVLAIADFGTARFTEELVSTVQTAPGQRLANFQYAAPEQRTPGTPVAVTADIYALGLILNEMFTGAVPHGTSPRLIASIAEEYKFLDEIVSKMLRQTPSDRPSSIADVKGLIQRYESEAVSLQTLSKIDGTVISASRMDEPLAEAPPKLTGVDWDGRTLTLMLDRPVNREWTGALHNMGSFSSVLGKPPQAFTFNGDQASIPAAEHEVQSIIDHFKMWLPAATLKLKAILEQQALRQEAQRKDQLRQEREAEEKRLRVLRNIRI
jgi:eukaryotic-like serine/threonine-protein kinase